MVDAALDKSGLIERYPAQWWESTTWYEVRDLLFEAGFVQEAQRAQFQAVPELADMTSFLNHEDVQGHLVGCNAMRARKSCWSTCTAA